MADKEATILEMLLSPGHAVAGEIGIEIEMEGQMLPHIGSNTWRSEADGSLRGESIEYVLKKPVAREQVAKVLTQLQDMLAKDGAVLEPSNRCGVHVHVNAQQYTFLQVMNIVVLYLMFEDILTKFCGQHREGNYFCLRARDAGRFVEQLIATMKNCSIHHTQQQLYPGGYLSELFARPHGPEL